jgi:two-component system sensor histidine kinase PhoQ
MGNLLDNAGKWSERCVELSLAQDSGTLLHMEVVDDGPGVTDAEIGKLGQRGLRLDEQTPGHGLGLAIVREIVERYGGTLHFTAAKKSGLCATIDIPSAILAAS